MNLSAFFMALRGPGNDWDHWYNHWYLKSPQWRIRRKIVLWLRHGRCQHCGQKATQVHHKTYKRVGRENLLFDLEAVCRDCHMRLHGRS